MANTTKLEVATPDGVVYSDDVEMVTLSGVEGQMTILPHHVRLMTQLVPGEIVIHKGGRDGSFAVGEGLVEVTGERVSILTDTAIAADKINEAMVEEARQRAAARLREAVFRRIRFCPRCIGSLTRSTAGEATPSQALSIRCRQRKKRREEEGKRSKLNAHHLPNTWQ